MDKEVSHLINRAKSESYKVLDLSHKSLSSLPNKTNQIHNLNELIFDFNEIDNIPKSIINLSDLTKISGNNNRLSVIPNYIGNLKKLSHLGLNSNQIKNIPSSVKFLKELNYLSLDNNKIREIPDFLGELKNLEYLSINNNLIETIPESITKLNKLKVLSLGGNKIKEIPDFICKISSLEKIYLFENRITDFPSNILNLINCKNLSLRSNQIKFIPKEIVKLKKIEQLDLSRNQIEILPKEIVQLEKLNSLYISGNPIVLPPPEIVERGLDGIQNYYRQIQEEGSTKLYEAKLLIVGEAGAGKTTLANKILDANYELLSENTTHGIDIHEYIFSYQDHDFRVNIWDFGGQEIYHATHCFFLTERSLYILVADERKEDTDFDYWLNIIQLLGKKSPVIILLNEKLGRQRKINANALRGQFPNIKEIISLDLSDNEKIPKLVNKIQAYLQTLDHIGDPLPKTWTNLRTFLETDGRNYLTLPDYLDLCDDFGFKDNTDKLSASQYLHDLGIILHFQDDALLNKTIILTPEWATDAVYQILDHPEIIANYGTFSRKDLSVISINTAFENMQDEILQLMLKFQLCYRITDTENNYISPQLLDPQQPKYRWQQDKNLLAEYRYGFMPKGIISRFIVVMHQLIENQSLVWRSGVILQQDNTNAEIIENLAQRKITLRVRGDHKRNLLTVIFHEIDKIHESYHALKVDKLIPCNCDKCKPSTTPYLFPLTDVNRAIAANRKTIECRYSFEPIGVKDLIDDIYDPATNLPSPAKPAEYMRDKGIIIKDSTVTISRNPVTEPNSESPTPKESTPQLPSFLTSAFAMGYLFALVAVVILVAASQLPPISLAIALIGITMLYVLIGVFTLRASGQTKDESMVTLVKTVLEQLPVLGNLFSFLKNLTQKE